MSEDKPTFVMFEEDGAVRTKLYVPEGYEPAPTDEDMAAIDKLIAIFSRVATGGCSLEEAHEEAGKVIEGITGPGLVYLGAYVEAVSHFLLARATSSVGVV